MEVDIDCLHVNWVRIPRELVLWMRSSPKPSCSPFSLNAGDAHIVTLSRAGAGSGVTRPLPGQTPR